MQIYSKIRKKKRKSKSTSAFLRLKFFEFFVECFTSKESAAHIRVRVPGRGVPDDEPPGGAEPMTVGRRESKNFLGGPRDGRAARGFGS